MLRPSSLLWSLMLVLPACGVCFGQVTLAPIGPTSVPPPAAAEQPPKLDPETEKKALDLVETLSQEVLNLHASTNRVRAQTQVADLLWARDEKRARNLFNAAVSQLVSDIAELDYGEPNAYNDMTRINALRTELVMRLAAHDGELAIAALKQTRFQGDNRTRYTGNYTSDSDANLEMSLANIIVAKSPETALKLARSSLSRGVASNIISFLPTLNKQDAKSGQALYQEIVGKIKDDNVIRNAELASNAWTLLNVFQPPQADEDIYRDLLTTMLGYLAANRQQTQQAINLGQAMYFQIERIMPLVEKYVPARLAEVKDWTRGVEKTIDPNARLFQELRQVTEKGTVDDILALLPKAPPAFQNLLYQNAAWKAVSNGDTARAKEIAEKIADPVQRRQVMDQLDNQAVRVTEGNNRVVEARRLAEGARTSARKVDILLQAALSVSTSDKKAALDLLSEAKSVLASSPQSSAELNAQFAILRMYLRLDPDQAFAMLQTMVVRLNEFVSAAVVLDGIDFRYLKDGEWVMQGGNGVSGMVMSIDTILGPLGRIDFDRARTLADQISRPEMRVMMEIDLVQATLNPKPMPNQLYFPRIIGGNSIIN